LVQHNVYIGDKSDLQKRGEIKQEDFGGGHSSLKIEYALRNVRNWNTDVSE
jgi:hypothetical protein